MAISIKTKRCSKCKRVKPLTEFSKNKTRKDGHQHRCKSCQSQDRKQYYQEHTPEALQYYQEHRSEILQKQKQWHKDNRPEILLRQKQYYQDHRPEIREKQKQRRNTIRGHLMNVWQLMLYRCNNPKCRHFKYYGGRGIRVKFVSFENFYNYVVKGLKINPRNLTIDRINNDGHYERDNIRFVTHAENCRNRSKQ